MKTLNTYVHVIGVDDDGQHQSKVFGPEDSLPDWARKAIDNPKVWDGEDDAAPAAKSADPVKQPPRKGPGSGGPAWIEFAASKGVTESFDSKEALIAELEKRDLLDKE